jgi:hypothetical protein
MPESVGVLFFSVETEKNEGGWRFPYPLTPGTLQTPGALLQKRPVGLSCKTSPSLFFWISTMDIVRTGLQAATDNRVLPGIGQGNTLADKGSAENASSRIPASTRVTLSVEGQARLAAEQTLAANPQQNTAQAQEVVAANRGIVPPVTPTAAPATLVGAPSAAVGQGATQAATASVLTAVLEVGNTSAPTSATNASDAPTNTAQTPATPETSNVLRQEVERAAQQEDSRRNDTAASRQDVGPALTQGAGAIRNALAA